MARPVTLCGVLLAVALLLRSAVVAKPVLKVFAQGALVAAETCPLDLPTGPSECTFYSIVFAR